MQADTYIPRRLDDQWKIGFWDVDVAAPILFMFFVGYLSGSKLSFAVCMAMGIFVSRWISRLKADKHPAFAIHWFTGICPNQSDDRDARRRRRTIRRMVG